MRPSSRRAMPGIAALSVATAAIAAACGSLEPPPILTTPSEAGAGSSGATGDASSSGTGGAGGTSSGSASSSGTSGTNSSSGTSGTGGTSSGGASSSGDSGGGTGPDGGPDVVVVRPPWGLEPTSNATCFAPTRSTPAGPVTIQQVFPAVTFDRPVEIVRRPGGKGFVVIEQIGRIHRLDDGATTAPTVLDIVGKPYFAGEGGLLGVAFHPQFPTKPYAYVYYTIQTSSTTYPERAVIARYDVSADFTFDPTSEVQLLTIDEGPNIHKGGKLAFGPDGFLYVSVGDGFYPLSAQDTTVLRGKILRLDVDGGTPYGIPADNPFANGAGKPEIYAWGMRNPWRFSFDAPSGDLWVADVGESAYDEVNFVQLGGNYGWQIREGAHCYLGAPCNAAGLVDPIVEYPTTLTGAIIGGLVYRGSAIPGLAGKYVHGSWFGRFFALDLDPTTYALTPVRINSASDESYRPTAFAADDDGELYFTNLIPGVIYKLVPSPSAPAPSGPATQLSKSGCVDAADATKPAAGVFPYSVNSEGWDDGAAIERWFAIPDGTKLSVRGAVDAGAPDVHVDLPPRSVTMQTFRVGGKRVETRLFVRHDDGGYSGFSYAWNDAETDATLVVGSRTRDLGGGKSWYYPSPADCLRCHTKAGGFTLGLELPQLDRTMAYPNDATNGDQLANLAHAALIDSSQIISHPKLVDPRSANATLDARARSYLHANCSSCHMDTMDLRITANVQTLCDAFPADGSLGITDARVIAKGDANRSVLSARMHRTDWSRMPPAGTKLVDPDGTLLIDEWIKTSACP